MKSRYVNGIIAVLLTLGLTMSLLPATAFAAVGAKDIEGHWAAPAIEACHTYGIMNGDGNGIYAPDRAITRAEFAAMVNRAFGYDALTMPSVTGYIDIPWGKWYQKEMQTAIALGVIEGYGGGIAAPEDRITREQAAVILYNVLRLTAEADTASVFTDMPDVSPWAKDAVLTMEQAGYIVGHGSTFMPKQHITRGEAAQLLWNVFGTIVDGMWNTGGAEFENVTIRKPGSYLANAVINGDLFITEGVGDGDVYLDNVWITGRLLLTGGGEHSIHVRNLTVGQNVVVDKPSVVGTESVRFRAIQSNGTTVVFEGKAREVIISDDITVLIDADDELTVFNMFAPADPAAKPQLVISSAAKVDKVVAAAPAGISGGGRVGKVEVQAGNVELSQEIQAEAIEAEKGVEVTVGGAIRIGEGLTDPTTIGEPEAMPQPPDPTPAPVPIPEPTPIPTPDPSPDPAPSPGGNTGDGDHGGTPTQYWSITFNGNGNTGGTVPTALSVAGGNGVTLPGNTGGLAKTGYTFSGWAATPDAPSGISGTYTPAADTTLYAVWTPAVLGGYASIIGTYKIGHTLSVSTGLITGGSGALRYQWRADGVDIPAANSAAYTIQASDVTKTISCMVTCDSASGSVTATGWAVPYTIRLEISGHTGTDGVSFDSASIVTETTAPGGSITVYYTLAPLQNTNLLGFSGVASAPPAISAAGSGTVSYTVSAADAANGVITIHAVFTHTSKTPQTITFADGNQTAVYGDGGLTKTASGGWGTGPITYASSNPTVATVDHNGQVTILKAGSTVITATKAEDATYAQATASYTLTVNPKALTIQGATHTKVYDGTTAANSVAVSLSGMEAGDTGHVSVSTVTAAYTSANAGTTTVNITAVTLQGAAADNYTVMAASGVSVAGITKKALTLTVVQQPTKTFIPFGTTDETYRVSDTAQVSVSGLVDGDAVTLSVASTYGLSITGGAVISTNGNATVTLTYDGMQTVTVLTGVSSAVNIASSINYQVATPPNIIAKLIDGQADTRPIPVTQANVAEFNSYAATALYGCYQSYYKQMENITLAPPAQGASNWTPIGSASYLPFGGGGGGYDGGGFFIKNLTVNTADDAKGMFGYVGTLAVVKNIQLADCRITGTGENVGGIAGHVSGTVQNCSVSGDVAGTAQVGGIVGGSEGGTITGCTSACSVTATGSSAGGVVGYQYGGTVTHCRATGDVDGGSGVGGVCGSSYGDVIDCTSAGAVRGTGDFVGGVSGSHGFSASDKIENCHSTGTVSGGSLVGGVAGSNTAKIIDSSAQGGVSGTGQHIGGVVGDNHGEIDTCQAKGNVAFAGTSEGNNGWNVGGVAGNNANDGTVARCRAEGSVTGDRNVGGVVGNNAGKIQYCYAAGNVTCNDSGGTSGWNAGGIAGYNSGSYALEYCYSLGDITGGGAVGGIAGTNTGNTQVRFCYAAGNISGTQRVGGIIGYNESGDVVSNCVALCGSVTATVSDAGRIVGNRVSGNVWDCRGFDGMTVSQCTSLSKEDGSDWSAADARSKEIWEKDVTLPNSIGAGFSFVADGDGWKWDESGSCMPSLFDEQIAWPL